MRDDKTRHSSMRPFVSGSHAGRPPSSSCPRTLRLPPDQQRQLSPTRSCPHDLGTRRRCRASQQPMGSPSEPRRRSVSRRGHDSSTDDRLIYAARLTRSPLTQNNLTTSVKSGKVRQNVLRPSLFSRFTALLASGIPLAFPSLVFRKETSHGTRRCCSRTSQAGQRQSQ